jgi:hypothetical protein
VCDSAYDPVDDLTDRRDVAEFRPVYGNGQNISNRYDTFTDFIAAIVQGGFSVLSGQRSVWRLLPFRPTDDGPLKVRDLPYLKVSLFKIRNAQLVAQTIGDPPRSLAVQAVLSLPIPAPLTDPGEVLLALTKLGLTASHSVDNRGTHKFKVDNDPTGQHLVLKGKLISRVGLKEIEPSRYPAERSEHRRGLHRGRRGGRRQPQSPVRPGLADRYAAGEVGVASERAERGQCCHR